MQLKKLLALLLSAALALSLLAGCGGESVARSLLALLDGKYANVSVEMDPDLEADLRQAIRTAESENAGDDAAAIRAALETLLGSKVTFRKLGEGQQGDTAFDLIFYAGADPDKAAQSAYSQWDPILSNVPADGKYDTSLAMVETNSGVWMLVKATVEKAGTVDKPDKDDEPDPVTLKSLTVTGPSTTNYEVGDKFDPNVLTVTAAYSNGKQEIIDATRYTATINDTQADGYRFTTAQEYTITVSFDGQTATVDITVSDNANGYYEDDGTYFVTGSGGLQKLFDTSESDALSANIILETDQTVTGTFGDFYNPFTGTLQSADPNNKVTITLTGGDGLFQQIDFKGTVENITFDVQTNITDTYADDGDTNAGAVAGMNLGTITNCTVTINGSISATGNDIANAGGIAGGNQGKIKGNSQVTIKSGGSIQATGTLTGTFASAGGLAGQNVGTVDDTYTYTGADGTIKAKVEDKEASVPNNDSNTDKKLDDNNVIKVSAGTKIGNNNGYGPVG